MSRKTESIYSSIGRLEDLRQEISVVARLAEADDESVDESGRRERIRHLEDIEFKMGQELKSLKFLISSLYLYNGKSTSRAKKEASKENGKKGGRPPKEITDARRRAGALEEDEIPRLLHKKSLAIALEDEAALDMKIEAAQGELSALRAKIAEWEEGRALKDGENREEKA